MSPDGSIVLRCDLGPTQGIGHLMRCVALAEELAATNARIVFSADASEMPFAREQIGIRGFDLVAPPEPTASAHLEQLKRLGAGAVVIDSYLLPADVYTALRGVYPTLAVVDGDPGARDADLFLDQNIGAEGDEWPRPPKTARLAGLQFALMRSDILEARPSGAVRPREEVPPRVFAFFGGSDAFSAAPDLTRAMVATGRPFALRVVGAGDGLRSELSGVLPGPGQTIEVIEPTSALVEEVVAADVVVSAAGSSSWELLCLGAACAFVCVAENQRLAYERVVAQEVVAGLGMLEQVRTDPASAAGTLGLLLGDPQERERLRAAASGLVDGLGRARVAEAFLDVWRDRSEQQRLI